MQNQYQFCQKVVRSYCRAKTPYNFSAKNITQSIFLNAVRLKESLTNKFVTLMVLEHIKQEVHTEKKYARFKIFLSLVSEKSQKTLRSGQATLVSIF